MKKKDPAEPSSEKREKWRLLPKQKGGRRSNHREEKKSPWFYKGGKRGLFLFTGSQMKKKMTVPFGDPPIG